MAWGVVEQLQTDYITYSCLAQRAFAARWAIAVRSPAESFAALARPPFCPPNLPSATAAGFFFFGRDGNCKVFFESPASANGAPMACSTTRKAFWAVSSLLDRLGI